MKIIPGSKRQGQVTRVLAARGEDFVSETESKLELTYKGIAGDLHEGLTREAGAREPWYPRGVEMRNERQVSILSEEDLSDIAENMGVSSVDAGWIGSNLVISGIANFSYLPPRTILLFEGGVTLRVDGYNAPCVYAGGAIAQGLGEQADDYKKTDTALSFVKAAHMKRGLVAWVEREGTISAGENFTARIWDQWIYE